MDVREQILKEATRLFAARGFEGTSLRDIAAAVGIRKQSVLYHFPAKDKLRLAVLGSLLERWNELVPKLMMAVAGGEPRFGAVMRATVSFFTEDADRARLLLREILDRPGDMRERLESHVRPWVPIVADYIRRGQKSGEVHGEVDPEAYTLQIINLVVSGVAAAASLDGGLLPAKSERGTATARHTRELIRIARYSLFVSPERDASIHPKSEDEAAEDRRAEEHQP